MTRCYYIQVHMSTLFQAKITGYVIGYFPIVFFHENCYTKDYYKLLVVILKEIPLL